MIDKHEDDDEKALFSTDKNGTKQLKLDLLLQTLIIKKCMGKTLDYARISGMTDRSLTQFERSIKNDFYLILEFGKMLLKEYGHIDDKQPPTMGR